MRGWSHRFTASRMSTLWMDLSGRTSPCCYGEAHVIGAALTLDVDVAIGNGEAGGAVDAGGRGIYEESVGEMGLVQP